jgi:hypothetical protein
MLRKMGEPVSTAKADVVTIEQCEMVLVKHC